MSIFNEFDLLRRSVGGIFDDFELSFFEPAPLSKRTRQQALQVNAQQRQLGSGKETQQPGKGGEAEEQKYGEESKRPDDTAVAERRLNSGAPGLFGGNRLRGLAQRPVDIRLDVDENDKQIEIHAEVPGVKKDDIDLSVQDGVLTLRAEKKEEKKEEDPNKKSLRVERSYGSAERSLLLPEYADTSKIEAKIDNGVLTITIPKRQQEPSKQQQIQIS